MSLTGTSQVFLENVGLSVAQITSVSAIDTEGYDIVDDLLPANRENFHVNALGSDSNIHAEAFTIHHISVILNHPQFFVAKRSTTSRRIFYCCI